MAAAIHVEGLVKRYGDLDAVGGISFEVEEGEVFAFLGPNGAGKTTTVEILEGYRKPTAGRVEVLGSDPSVGGRRFKERIGIVLQEHGLPQDAKVHELLELFGGYFPRRLEADVVLDLVDLGSRRDVVIRVLSGGERRRLDFALALVGDPDLIFLDEPTTGFDPEARRNSWEIIRNLCALGKTVFLTTHYMDEAQELADRIAVIAGGRIVASGPPANIGGRERAETHIRFSLPLEVASKIPQIDGAVVQTRDSVVEILTHEPTQALKTLTMWAVRRRIELDGLTVTQPTLEDVYLQLVGSSNGKKPRARRKRARRK